MGERVAEGLVRAWLDVPDLGERAAAALVNWALEYGSGTLRAQVAAHSAVEMDPSWRSGMVARLGWADLGGLLRDPAYAAVAPRLVEAAPLRLLSEYVRGEAGMPGGRVHPAAVAAATNAALRDDVESAWVALRYTSGSVQTQLLDRLRGSVGAASLAERLEWLCAAAAHPDRCASWAQDCADDLSWVLTRLTHEHALGRSAEEWVAAQVVEQVTSRGANLPPWLPPSARLTLEGEPTFVWPLVVAATGLEQVAHAAVDALGVTGRLVTVVEHHPGLATADVAWDVADACSAWMGDVDGVGPDGDLRYSWQVANWATSKPRSSAQLLEALTWLVELDRQAGDDAYSRAQAGRAFAFAAAQIACVGPEPAVIERACRLAWGWLACSTWPSHDSDQTRAMLQLASARAAGAGVGVCAVELAGVHWDWALPEWLSAQLTAWAARLPQARQRRFVTAIVDMGPHFVGTFDELAATAAAVSA